MQAEREAGSTLVWPAANQIRVYLGSGSTQTSPERPFVNPMFPHRTVATDVPWSFALAEDGTMVDAVS